MLVFAALGCVDQASFTPIGEISLTGPAEALVIRSRGTVAVPFSVDRGTGQDGAITISAAGLPSGVELEPYELPVGVSQGSVTLRATMPELGNTTPFSLVAEASGGKVASITLSLRTIGEAGTVDSSYGVAGRITIASNIDRYCSTRMFVDGSVLLDSSPLDGVGLTKLLSTGSPDSSFGNSGTLLLSPLVGSLTRARFTSVLMEVLPDGRILIGATGDDPSIQGRNDSIVIFRVAANGAIDGSFGTNGFVVIDGPGRLHGMATAVNGDSFIWYSRTAIGDAIMTRLQPNGAFGGSSPPFSTFSPAASDLLVQSDGKLVMLVNEGGGYSLVRLTSSLQLDPSFGRGGIMPIAGTPTIWVHRADGSFFGVGGRYNFPTPGNIAAHAVHFDSSWKPLMGFDMGGVTMTDVPNFLASSTETTGGTLASVAIEGEARLLFLSSEGRRDLDFGTRGWRVVTQLPLNAGGLGLTATNDYHALMSISVPGQSCQLYRIWR